MLPQFKDIFALFAPFSNISCDHMLLRVIWPSFTHDSNGLQLWMIVSRRVEYDSNILRYWFTGYLWNLWILFHIEYHIQNLDMKWEFIQRFNINVLVSKCYSWNENVPNDDIM